PGDPAFGALAQANKVRLNLEVSSKLASSNVGHQFLFPAFPLGVINLESPAESFKQALEEELALAGFYSGSTEPTPGAPQLIATLDRLSLSGYDLVFVRKIVCSVHVSGSYSVKPE